MNPGPDTIEQARNWFAEDLRISAGVKNGAVVNAFARVPRESFLGPPPWRVGTRMMGLGGQPMPYQTFEGDARVLYHDVVVALDEENEINNGQPSLWAKLFDELGLRPGEHILHLGCGSGYYTAVMAEIVGSHGSVSAVEINGALAERARQSLRTWPNVSVTSGDGSKPADQSSDVIVVSAGATHPLPPWLDSLRPNGRLLFPLTVDGPRSRSGSGAMLLVWRLAESAFGARFVVPAGFIHFEGARDAKANERLTEAYRKRFPKAGDLRSLRRDQHEADETCWLHGDGFCLSYREPD